MPEQPGILTGEMHRNRADIIYQIAGLSGMGEIFFDENYVHIIEEYGK
jgi:hypothetical protein